jgi:hypothetical protein
MNDVTALDNSVGTAVDPCNGALPDRSVVRVSFTTGAVCVLNERSSKSDSLLRRATRPGQPRAKPLASGERRSIGEVDQLAVRSRASTRFEDRWR